MVGLCYVKDTTLQLVVNLVTIQRRTAGILTVALVAVEVAALAAAPAEDTQVSILNYLYKVQSLV